MDFQSGVSETDMRFPVSLALFVLVLCGCGDDPSTGDAPPTIDGYTNPPPRASRHRPSLGMDHTAERIAQAAHIIRRIPSQQERDFGVGRTECVHDDDSVMG